MSLRVATWNVNGLRARAAQFLAWLAAEQPRVVCLQEIKCRPEQLPPEVHDAPGYWWYWHGGGGYSGVALGVHKEEAAERPVFAHPEFDHETRIVTAELRRPGGAGDEGGGGEDVLAASIYVPNGGKDYQAKLTFLRALGEWAAAQRALGRRLVLCGDLNVARTDRDVHPKERKPDQIGTRPDERALLEALLAADLVDVGRTLDPDNDNLFTYWAPWRNLRQRNIGWRIDYVLASSAVAARAERCRVAPEVGTSDHAPVVADFGA
jgi:exodeoxyribonuclease III